MSEQLTHQEASQRIAVIYQKLDLQHQVVAHGLLKDEKGWLHHAYTYRFNSNGAWVEFDWKQGTGIKERAKPHEVLACVCRDFSDARDEDFESWAGNFGYDTDSRSAEKIWRECRALGPKLKALQLRKEQIDRLAELHSML